MINEGKSDIEEIKLLKMAPATRLKCGLPTCTLGEEEELGGVYLTPAHLATIDQTQIAMSSHMDVQCMMQGHMGPQMGGG